MKGEQHPKTLHAVFNNFMFFVLFFLSVGSVDLVQGGIREGKEGKEGRSVD